METLGIWPTCQSCGTAVTKDQRFCGRCGTLLEVQQPQAEHTDALTQLSQTVLLAEDVSNSGSRMGATATGTIIGGRYRIVRFVSRGGFGAIYEAHDIRFPVGRIVAIKEISNAHLDDNEKALSTHSFRQEATLLAQLKHFNLPSVLDFFEEGDKVYLVMEFIQGVTLERLQEITEGPLGEEVVMGWALQLCNVLHYLHNRPQPIIFRDLKPTNVMVTKEGQIKLIDFGIARTFKAEATQDTKVLGSRSYAAPEQYGSGQSDARTDIYALGATLYVLLTGTPPLEATFRQEGQGLFKMPRELNPGLSVVTEQIILKAMALEPRDRFQSADELFSTIESSDVVHMVPHATRVIPSVISARLSDSQTLSVPRGPTLSNQLTPPLLVPESDTSGSVASSGITEASGIRPPAPLPTVVREASLADPKGFSRRHMVAGGLGVAALLALGGAGAALLFSNRGSSQSQVAGRSAATTIPFIFTCSPEKRDWMQAAVNAFHKSGATVNSKDIQIELDLRGSVDAQQRILNGSIQPIVWSPASFLELNQLNSAWQQSHVGQDIIVSSGDLQPKELVFSPLVFAIWRERANVLLKHYGTIDWPSIHDALKLTNWSAIGGQAEWGPVKFGHTRPDKSNSGLLTITLLAYAFYSQERGLTVRQIDDSQFLSYFNDIEGAVYGFGRSSGTFIKNVMIPLGPPEFDMATTYENLVLTSEKQAINAQHQPLEMFYPGLNIVSDHPFAILQGKWVTPEQQMAARTFRDFLLSIPQQRLALTTGFRPANINVQITDNLPGNVFLQQSSTISIKPQIQPLAQVPTSAVINELIKQWKASYDGSATTLG